MAVQLGAMSRIFGQIVLDQNRRLLIFCIHKTNLTIPTFTQMLDALPLIITPFIAQVSFGVFFHFNFQKTMLRGKFKLNPSTYSI